jgi:hypothetical protein
MIRNNWPSLQTHLNFSRSLVWFTVFHKSAKPNVLVTRSDTTANLLIFTGVYVSAASVRAA